MPCTSHICAHVHDMCIMCNIYHKPFRQADSRVHTHARSLHVGDHVYVHTPHTGVCTLHITALHTQKGPRRALLLYIVVLSLFSMRTPMRDPTLTSRTRRVRALLLAPLSPAHAFSAPLSSTGQGGVYFLPSNSPPRSIASAFSRLASIHPSARM